MAGKRAREVAQRKSVITSWPLYLLLVASFILYVVYQGTAVLAEILGVSTFALIIAILIIEVINGSKEEGKVRNVVEIIAAVVIVIAIWFALQAVLQTRYPIDAVPSCSMLPYLQRGDMIVLHGANASSIRAPQVTVTKSALQGMLSNINNESLECVAYKANGRTANVSQEIYPGYSVGLFKPGIVGGSIMPYSEQGNNLVKYQCGAANVTLSNGTRIKEAYTTSITVANTTITGDLNNSVIVYQTEPQDSFYRDGDSYIVHRVYAIINADGSYYYLTKGDNNPGLDMQYFNTPPAQAQVEGRVIARIPYLGFLKLILSGTLSQPSGCNSTFQN